MGYLNVESVRISNPPLAWVNFPSAAASSHTGSVPSWAVRQATVPSGPSFAGRLLLV